MYVCMYACSEIANRFEIQKLFICMYAYTSEQYDTPFIIGNLNITILDTSIGL